MTRVTRDVAVADVADLLDGSHRACLAFSGPDGPEVVPVVLRFFEGRYVVGVADRDIAGLDAGAEAVLLVDDGIQWFDLRAVYARGVIEPSDPPPGARAGPRWFEVVPRKAVAWDYGSLREVGDES